LAHRKAGMPSRPSHDARRIPSPPAPPHLLPVVPLKYDSSTFPPPPSLRPDILGCSMRWGSPMTQVAGRARGERPAAAGRAAKCAREIQRSWWWLLLLRTQRPRPGGAGCALPRPPSRTKGNICQAYKRPAADSRGSGCSMSCRRGDAAAEACRQRMALASYRYRGRENKRPSSYQAWYRIEVIRERCQA